MAEVKMKNNELKGNVFFLRFNPGIHDVVEEIRLFISHSGLLSTEEAVYHGVPMVSLPVLCDQNLKTKRAAEAGIAVTVEILDLTEKILEEAIHKVLTDSSFKERVQKMSTYIRDQAETPKDASQGSAPSQISSSRA